jgi:RHS repeat-associated protein
MGNAGTWAEAEVSVAGVTKYYAFGGGRVAMRTPDGVFYLHPDHLGSTSLATTAAGAVHSRQGYYPYGETRYAAGTLPTDFGFTGQRNDATIGLYDYHARWYDPFIGRFISADTIVPNPGNPQDFNRYSYVRNNPLKYVDPDGHGCVIIDGDEYCRDDLPDKHFVPSVDTWSWDILSEEEKSLGYEAYLRFRENPDYYRSLYWSDPNNLELIHLQLWAEYAENDELPDFLGLDTVREAIDRLDALEQQRASGDIGDEEFGELKIPLLFVMLAAEIPDESGDSGQFSQRFSPDQDALIQLAKEAKRMGGVDVDEAEILEAWANEYGISFRGPEVHPNRPHGRIPHIHVGPVDHIPVR